MVRSVEGLSTKVLNSCLRKNIDFGIIERIAYPEIPPRVEYVVTPFGKKFVRILDELEKLQDEIADLRTRGAEEFHFTELRQSAQILRGVVRWNRSCEGLHQEILAFLQNFAQQPIPEKRRIHLTIDL